MRFYIQKDLWNDKEAYFEDACKELDLSYEFFSFDHRKIYPQPLEEQNILIGSVNLLKSAPKEFMHFTRFDNLTCSYAYPLVPKKHLLNADGLFLPWGSFKQNPLRIFDLLDNDKIFVRSDSSKKTLPGEILDSKEVFHQINVFDQSTSVTHNTMCLFAPFVAIVDEMRFVVADNKPLTASYYMRQGEITEASYDDSDCFDFVQKICEENHLSEHIDDIFVVDVVLTNEGEYKVNEFNGVSCSGWYECNYKKILQAMVDYA